MDGSGENFLVFYNDIHEGQDVTQDILAAMGNFGSVTDAKGNEIHFAVKHIDDENFMYEVAFLDATGTPVNFFKVEPKKAPAPQPDPTDPAETTPTTEATEEATEPAETTAATEGIADVTPTEESSEPESNAPTGQTQAPTQKPVDNSEPGNPTVLVAVIAVAGSAAAAGAFLLLKKRR